MNGLFDGFARFASAFLNATQQFIFRAFGEGEVIVGELRPLLFQFAFGDVPVAFDFKFSHSSFFEFGFLFAVNVTTKIRQEIAPSYGV